MNRKVEVSTTREVHTYAELWHTSYCLLEMGKESQLGLHHKLMGSIVFTAFALEAYLNHIGPKLFDTWEHLEKLSPRAKLDVVSEKIGITADYGARPCQTVIKLFGFRNDIAHGKSITLKDMKVKSLDEYNKDPWSFRVFTDWEKFCTLESAERSREDVDAIVHMIHDAAKLEGEYPFTHGLEVGGGSLISEDAH